jgi:hypothetical protein
VLFERIRSLAWATLCVAAATSSASTAPAPIGAGSHPISPAVASFWFVEQSNDEVKTLPLLVFLEGTPGWLDRKTTFDWSVSTTPATIDFKVGDTPIRARYWADRGRIEIAGQSLDLASHNVILVTGIDGAKPGVKGLGRHDLTFPADRMAPVTLLRRDRDVVAALLHEPPSPVAPGTARWVATHQRALAALQAGHPDSDRVALALWRVAAAEHDAAAEYRVGMCYGVGRGVTTDLAAANAWYRKSADHGFVDAQFKLAYSFATGRGGPIDTAAAVTWFTRAADQGDAEAQYQLATLYAQGGKGVGDPARASLWYQKSAEGDLAGGQFETARRYHEGVGVAADPARAYAWWLVLERNRESFDDGSRSMADALGKEVQAHLDEPARRRAETARTELLAIISRRTLEEYLRR